MTVRSEVCGEQERTVSRVRSSSGEVALLYYPSMVNRPMDLQSTMIRGQIDLELAYPEHLMPVHDPHKLMSMIENEPKDTDRRYYSPILSNFGKVQMSESMEDLITNIDLDELIPKLLFSYAGIITFNDEVCMFFDHKYRDTALFDEIRAIMQQNGITSVGHDMGRRYEAKVMYEK